MPETIQRYAGPAIEKVASGSIDEAKAVAVVDGYAVYADSTNLLHRHLLRGLSRSNYSDGETVLIQVGERFKYDSWDWTPKLPVYLSASGELTQVQPVTGFVQQVGVADTPTEIYIRICQAEEVNAKHVHIREQFVLSGTDISNKFILLGQTPADPTGVSVYVEGAGFQNQIVDYVVDGTNLKKIRWNGLALEPLLSSGDVMVVRYYRGVS